MYKAEDTRLGRLVALKFLPPEGRQDAHAQARFEREAQAASALNHHNICTVYDIGEQDGQTFIAMELLEGVTLQEKIGSRPVPLPALLDYATQAVAALEVAHEHGIVHRDVKPSNIFITSRGEVKLADFGLAKRVMMDGAPNGEAPTMSVSITGRGAIVGTVAYMSPEQAQDKDVDARSDIFSFGVVLYEMATGKRAFPGESAVTILAAILHKDPKPIRELNVQVSEELQRIVAKTLEKDREDRYQTTRELMVDLRRLAKKETERPAESSKERRSEEVDWNRRGPGSLRRSGVDCAHRPQSAPRVCATADGAAHLFERQQRSLDRYRRITHLFRQRTRSCRNVRQGRRGGAFARRDRHYEHSRYFTRRL